MHQRVFGWFITLCGLLLLSVNFVAAQTGVRAVVVNEHANIRIVPAIGASVIDTVDAGYVFEIITARSGDNQWLRVEYGGSEGWVNVTPIVILEGDINTLPFADPRAIPYGGFESPRAGYISPIAGSTTGIATDGLRVRAGPSTGYPTLNNINFNQSFVITGRNAAATWYQVVFEDTLGWVASAYVQVSSGTIGGLPIGGIVAERAPTSAEAEDEYIGLLQFMLDRLNIAQNSLNQIRTAWTDAAINGRAICQAYPARPTNMSVAVPVMAAHYNTLNPLVNDFNDAMTNVRHAIDLFIEVCNQPGTANPVGQATAQGSLGVVQLADQQFASLRERLNDLIPELTISGDQCLLRYNGRAEKLPLIHIGVIYLDDFTLRTNARGYCFNGLRDQVLNLQTLPIPPNELSILVTVSALDNPTQFLTLGQSLPGASMNLGPIILPNTTTYIVLMADLGQLYREAEDRSTVGDYAFRLIDTTFATANQQMAYDEATQSVVLIDSVQVTTGQPIVGPDVVCPSTAFTCQQLFTCNEAIACQQAGNFSLDSNQDGIPCNESAGGTPALCQP